MIELIQNRLSRALFSVSPAKSVRTHSGTVLGTDVGSVRKRNEDCCLIVRATFAARPKQNFTIAIVCDGLGGMREGRDAAITAASVFVASLVGDSTGDVRQALLQAMSRANEKVFQKLRGDGGTTLSAVFTAPHSDTYMCHVGDSRVYGVLPDRRVKQLSRDDTMSAVLNKPESPEDALKDSRLLQYVGMGDELEAQVMVVSPEYKSVLLTSDGAHDVPPSVFQRLVTAAVGGADLIRKLLTMSEILGGRDNASAVLIPVGGEGDLYEEFLDTEIQAILPNETLSIYLTDMKIHARGDSQRLAPPSSSPQIADLRLSAKDSDKALIAAGSKQSSKAKGPNARSEKPPRPRKPKKDQPALSLPLDVAGVAVDIQFSTPTSDQDDKS